MSSSPSIRLRGPHAVGALVLALFGCGKTIATVRLGDAPTGTREVAVSVPGGARIGFSAYASSYSGQNRLRLQAELLRNGAVVAAVKCPIFDSDGAGCGSSQSSSACSFTAPEGGADAVRLETRFEGGPPIAFENLEIQVIEGRFY